MVLCISLCFRYMDCMLKEKMPFARCASMSVIVSENCKGESYANTYIVLGQLGAEYLDVKRFFVNFTRVLVLLEMEF